MRVAIVHDDLVQWGGAEKVLEGICEIYPDAPIFTSVFDKKNPELKRAFADKHSFSSSKKVITSFMQKIPGWKNIYKQLLLVYPIAFEQFNFDEYDLVISHGTRFAKSIITKPQTIHINYCHTPPRFLWHFSGPRENFFVEGVFSKLRIYDRVSASRVDHFLAGSENAKKRIKKIYRRDSKVVYPFIDLERFSAKDGSASGWNGGYFVVLGRPNRYKRFDLAKKACQKLGVELKVISGQDNKTVTQILAGAKALIVPGIEDFGLVSLEAQALGKPVIAFAEGGSLETVIDKKTGIFFNEQTVDSLAESIKKIDKIKFDSEDLKNNAEKFSKKIFLRNFKQTVDSLLYTK